MTPPAVKNLVDEDEEGFAITPMPYAAVKTIAIAPSMIDLIMMSW